MARRAVDNTAGNGQNDFLSIVDSDFNLTNTDSFIIGGWFDFSAQNTANGVICSNSTVGDTLFSLETDTIGNQYFFTYFSGNFINPAPLVSGRVFFLGWVDTGANTINFQIDNGTVTSSGYSPTVFSKTSNSFRFYNSIGNPAASGLTGILDNWFYCKNPASMATAISTIQSTIYNSGNGNHYVNLTPTEISDIGLVSWWAFDESGLATREDSHGSNDLTVNGTFITDTSPLVAGEEFTLDLDDIVTPADTRSNQPQLPKSDSFSITDTLTKQPQIGLADNLFLDDFVRTSPLLIPMLETLSLGDWISIKRNPARSEWVS